MKRRLLATVLLTTGISLALLLACLPVGRWWELQRLGEVPEGTSFSTQEGMRDWRIAAWTTWWGKELDPEEFWKDRPIWHDGSAGSAARRRGRGYPPIPTHLTNLAGPFSLRSPSRHKDIVSPPNGPDSGPSIPYHGSDAESAYWNWFWRTQPKPPVTLEREQFQVAETILRLRKPLLVRGVDQHAHFPAHERLRSERVQKDRAGEIGVPTEALSEDALFWAYVMRQRQQYAKELAQVAQLKSHRPDLAERFLDNFLERLLVDTRLVTDPLTGDQLKAANAWKVAYLQRLRRENADESYINAYLTAWEPGRYEAFGEEPHK